MADILCPMCSKTNPPEAEFCHSCQARLKPLIVPFQASQPPEDHTADWLRELRDDGILGKETPSSTIPISSEPPAYPAGEMPDWLARIRQHTQDETGAVSQIGPAPKMGENPPESPDGLPEWLRDLSLQDTEPSDLPGGTQSPPPQPLEAPVEPFGEQQPQVAPLDIPSELDNDAWLRSLGDWSKQTAAESQPSAAATPVPPASPEINPPSSASNFGLADWLNSLDEQTQPAASPPETSPGASDTEWLKDFDASASQPAQPATSREADQPFTEQTPDWLSDFGAQTDAAATSPSESPQQTPDWLIEFEKEASAEEVSPLPIAEEAPQALPADSVPEWLRAEEPQPPAVAKPTFASSEESDLGGVFTSESEGFAQWAAEEVPLAAQATNPPGAGIEPAQLPAWLQAMRPLDDSIPESKATLEQEIVEKSGPLAGINGVLPGEELVSHFRTPPTYSAQLRISEKQQVLAALIETVVAEEPLSQPLKGQPLQAPRLVLRLLVGLLLMGVIIFGLLSKPWLGISTAQIAPGTAVNQVSRSINELAEGASVLVVIDYEAGLSGELKAVSLPVINHLMSRKARITLISTQPVGSVLGEVLLKEAAASSRGGVVSFAVNQSSANLGYLVGGALSIRELALPMNASVPRPLQQSFPNPFRAENGWNGLVLKSLSQLTDFKRVFLLTDSVESGRAWVEQIQPALQNKSPLIVISSAQAAPLLQPYQASGQVSALLSGVVGGRGYEEIQNRPAFAGTYWNAYQYGLGLAVLLILLGGMVGVLKAPSTRNKKQNQARG